MHDHDGYRKTRTPGIKDANSTEAWAARLQFSFDLSDALGVQASPASQRSRSGFGEL